MKKTLLLLASAALLLVGCAKEQVAQKTSGEGKQTVSFTVGVESAATKAVADGDGAAANINHWIMQVLDSDGEVYNYQEKDGAVGEKTQTFDVPLVKGQTYQVLFWADTKGNYVVTDLRTVKRAEAVALTANRDGLDAFSAVVNDFATVQATQQNITLKRPFAQLNVVFTDLKKLYETMGSDAEYTKFKPVDFVAKAKVPTTFNVLTQEAGAPAATALEMKAATNYKDNYTAHGEKATLYMDYILASAASKDIVDIDFSFVSKGVTIAHSFASIPFQRNYRTHIIGELMSAGATWNVVVDDTWDLPENEQKYVTEGSVAAALEALAEGKTAIEITAPEDYATPVAIPAQADGKDISIKVSGVTGKDMTFKLGDGAQGPANLYITSDAQNLKITLPNSHVEVNGGTYNEVTATTSANTLVVGADVTIASLKVDAGNVEIHGKVANLTRANGVKAKMYASDRATLINYINWAKSGETVGLECDIDLAGENWTPAKIANVETIANFDGCGHSIKNMTIVLDASSSTPYGGGFYESIYSNGTMKNVTFENAEVKSTEDGKGNVFGIAAGYAYGNVTFENIKVKDSKVSAFGKVGGILGMAADPGTHVTTMKNCSLENVEIIGTYNVANYIGLLQNNVSLTGCSSTNVKKKLSVRYGEDAYVTFDKVKVIDNSDPDNPEYVLSSGKYWKYVDDDGITYMSAFADCYNDMKYEGWKALDGVVDAVVFNTPETPQPIDLEPVATIGEKKYYDLPSALAALQQGETLEIVQAGEYSVETLTTAADITIDAKVDGVVFKHTPVATSWLTNQVDGRTVKNITWNVGTAHHQYLHGVNLVNCKIEGMICTHSNSTYTNCEFYNEDSYNLWEYGTGSTFIGCKFTCPGGPDGKGGVINAYNEGHQEGLKTVILKDCEFIALEPSDKYSVIYIKPETDFDIQFTNCTFNDNFCTGDKSGSKLWNVKNNSNLNTKVTVDGKLVYANGTVLNITTADQLMAFAAAVNGGNSFAGKTVYLGADIDLAGTTWIPAGSMTSYPSITFEGTFDGQNHTISNLKASDNTQNYATAGLFGSLMGTVKNVTLKDVNISSTHYAGAIMGYSSSSSVVIDNCSVIGGTITSVPELIGTEYDNGDKCGGIVGYAGDAPCTISNCTVEGVTVRAYRDLGGIAGASNAKISNCSVKNSSVIQDNTNAYKDGVDTFHEILGRDLGATLTGNTFENVTVKSEN